MSKNYKSKKSSGNDKESENCTNSLKSNLQNKKVFRIPSHADGVLKELNKQRLEGKLCDVTVLVEHRRFQAHKCVLSANSSYFKNLLLSDNDGIFLRHVSAESFKAILDFMYTSRLELEPNTLQEVLKASKFLLIKSVVSICCRFLETQIKLLEKNLGKFKNTASDPVLLSINSGLLKNAQPPQQAPHITFDPTTGTFSQSPLFRKEESPFASSQHEAFFNQQQQRLSNSYNHQPTQHLPNISLNNNSYAPRYRIQGDQAGLNYLHGKQLYNNNHSNVQLPANYLQSNMLLPSPSYGDVNKNLVNEQTSSGQQCLPNINYENKTLNPHMNEQLLRSLPQSLHPRVDPGSVSSSRKSLNMVFVDCNSSDINHDSKDKQGSCSRAKTAKSRHKSYKRANSPPVVTLSINSKSVKSDDSSVSKISSELIKRVSEKS